MAHLVYILNPFEPFKETKVEEIKGGIAIAEHLRRESIVFNRPVICIVEGRPLLRKEWEKYIIEDTTIVNFVAVQGAVIPAIYWIFAAIVVAAVAVALVIAKPVIPGQVPEPDPVYDLKGQRNQVRLGSPIEVPYGRCRLWPSYAARPYNQYIGNEQYQYQLFCLGQGEYDDVDAFIEDTPLGNFPAVEYDIYPPGATVTLFPDNVLTSVEVAGIEMFGPNETGFGGESGPFVLNGPGTLANRIEVDIVLPVGLFFAGSNGKLQSRQITALFEYQQIDDSGAPIGSWVTLSAFDRTLSTNTPQRFTLGLDVDPGRYQVRGERTNAKDTDSNAGNTLRWDSARAFLPSTKDYGNVTLYALKVRATNNLNDRSSNRFNVWATRRLPMWDAETELWSDLTATRSIVWAYCDLFRANYGGRLADQFLDLPALAALDAIYTALGWTFDFVFEQRGTVWEMAKVIARAGRAVPMLNISQVTMIRDYPKTIPTAVFNQENIVQGSFKWDVNFAELDEYDGVEIEYTDPTTFLPATVKCLVGDDAGDNCEQIKFPGCTSKDRAYQEGLYIRRTRINQRDNITFETGLEGRMPAYGSLIKVVHDLPRWGQGGLVLSIVGTTVTLSEPADFSAGGTHKLGLRKKNGELLGPYTVTAGAAPNQVELASSIDTSDLNFDLNSELPLYYFGKENLEGMLCIVVGLSPNEDTVEVKAVIADNSIFDGDATTAPITIDPPLPPKIPDVPSLDCTSIVAKQNPLDSNRVQISWQAALGANKYLVQRSADGGTTWTDVIETTGIGVDIPITQGETVMFQVQPIGKGAGLPCQVATGFGSSGKQEPDCDDSYYCYLPIIAPTLLTISCKERGGLATLCGYSEYPGATPSDPPKKYRKQTLSGEQCDNDVGTAVGCPDCSGFKNFPDCNSGSNPDNGSLERWGGYYIFNKYDCSEANGQTHEYGVAGAGNIPCESISLGTEAPPTRDFDEVTFHGDAGGLTLISTILKQWISSGVCFIVGTIGGVPIWRTMNGTVSKELSDEDTEDDALDRLKATFTDWEDIIAVGCGTLPCCETWWTKRNTTEHPGRYPDLGLTATAPCNNPDTDHSKDNFRFCYKEAMVLIHVEGMTDSGFSICQVHIWRTKFDDGTDELAEIRSFETYADAFGGADFNFLLPVERGYKHYVKKLEFRSILG